MNPMTTEDTLREWMGERIAAYAKFEAYGEAPSDPGLPCRRVRLSTRWADYTIVYDQGRGPFLMAFASVRQIRPGETWQRGDDLPDGPFTKEMWDEIMRAIVRYELIEILEPELGVASPSEPVAASAAP